MASLIFICSALSYDYVKSHRASRRARKAAQQTEFEEMKLANARRMGLLSQHNSWDAHRDEPAPPDYHHVIGGSETVVVKTDPAPTATVGSVLSPEPLDSRGAAERWNAGTAVVAGR